MNNASLFSADRTTHLKIVVVSLLASIVVMVAGIGARSQPPSGSLPVTIDNASSARTAASEAGAAIRSKALLTQVNVAGRETNNFSSGQACPSSGAENRTTRHGSQRTT